MKLESCLRTINAPSDAPLGAALVFSGAPAIIHCASQLLATSSSFRSTRVECPSLDAAAPHHIGSEQANVVSSSASPYFAVIDVFSRGRVRCIFVSSGCFHGERLLPTVTLYDSPLMSSASSSSSSPCGSVSCSVVAAFAHCVFPAVTVRELAIESSTVGALLPLEHRSAAASPAHLLQRGISQEIVSAVLLAVDPLAHMSSGSAGGPMMTMLPSNFLTTPETAVDLLSRLVSMAARSASTSPVIAEPSSSSSSSSVQNPRRNDESTATARCRNRLGRSEEVIKRTLAAVIAMSSTSPDQSVDNRGHSHAAAVSAVSTVVVPTEKAWSEWTVARLHDWRGKAGLFDAFKVVVGSPEDETFVLVPTNEETADQQKNQRSLTAASVSSIVDSLSQLQSAGAATANSAASASQSLWERSIRQANAVFERKQQLLLRQQRQQQNALQNRSSNGGSGAAGGEDEASSSTASSATTLRRTASGENVMLVADEGDSSYETDQILKALTAKRESMSLARRAEEWMANMSAQAVPAPLRNFARTLPITWRFWLTPMGFIVIGTGLLMIAGVFLIFMS